MIKTLSIILILTTINAYAQKEADNWYFGQQAGITFSTTQPTFLSGGSVFTAEGSSSVSDANGNLLFYSDGITVWDKLHNPMPNGTNLLGGESSTQSCLIVKQPGSALYYIFTTTEQESSVFEMNYSIVDMSLNNGYGDVSSLNNLLLVPSTEKLTAVRHSNGTDLWIIGHEFDTNNFMAYLLSSTGINITPVISAAGTSHGGIDFNAVGYMKASPCGNKIACAVSFDSFVELFDFNNTTGIVSNPVFLGTFASPSFSGPYGVEFSPDCSRLYASITDPASIIQWNLNAGSNAAIIASATTVVSVPNAVFGALQNAPDGRIYLANYDSSSLGCITNPNALGLASSFVSNFVSLNFTVAQLGLPNFPPYYFITLNVNLSEMNSITLINNIYPNPASEFVNIDISQPSSDIKIELVNTMGTTVSTIHLDKYSSAKNINFSVDDLINGVYLLRIQSNDWVESKYLLIN